MTQKGRKSGHAALLYAGGVDRAIQVALREDGAAFKRARVQTKFGWGWSRWTFVTRYDISAPPIKIQHGLWFLEPVKDGAKGLRLPL